MKTRKCTFAVAALIAVFGLLFAACKQPSDSGTTPTPGVVAKPTATPAGGNYTKAQTVTLATATTGADIHYTLDGNTPTTSSTKYTVPIMISETATLKAIAVKTGMINSGIMTEEYTISQFIVPGSTLAEKLAWLQTNAQSDNDYTLEVNADESITPHTLFYSGKSNIGVTLTGVGTERTVSLSSNGSLFTVGNTVTLTLGNNITLRGNDGNDASLVQVNSDGTLVMNTGSKITDNTFAYGSGVYVADGNFIMNGGEISGNTTNSGNGGGVYVYGNFTMNDGEIFDNTAAISGGGVYVHGNFIMNGGVISDNTATSDDGGGVYVYQQESTFTMNGGAISSNTSARFGGGVFLDISGIFTMIDGEISDNTANYGGVFVASNGTFTMSGGKISDNTTTSGGGVYIAGTFTMLDGVISDNTAANNGGGVFMETNGTFTIINGIIKGNTATNIGGGVFVSGTGTFRIVTGTIYGSNEAVASFRNTATLGAALYKESSGTSAECGTFIGEEWNKAENGDLDTTNNTIKVIGGMLQ